MIVHQCHSQSHHNPSYFFDLNESFFFVHHVHANNEYFLRKEKAIIRRHGGWIGSLTYSAGGFFPLL